MTDLCIMVAPNGARRTKADHPALPISPADLADTARACHAAGAGAIHLHVRDNADKHSLDPDRYRAAIAAVEAAAPGMAVQTTTEAAGVFDLSEQIASVEALNPACVSFSIKEMMRDGRDVADRFLAGAAARGTAIQFILYDPDEIALFADLYRERALHLRDTPRVIVVAGRYAATQNSDLADYKALHAALKAEKLTDEAIWMTCAFGTGEMACLAQTIDHGGHVRVGFENAIVDASGKPARDNNQRVAMVAALARDRGRQLADGDGARAILGTNKVTALL
ncbi:uncharacterized protein (DUF849 family) [Maritimibacter alkaliphilus HTCC2654]|nr:3-keto-5-aminohexanoate cleavage protein [Maritimibacter alkaliphilus]TYP83440.1 uncharacterized protein (DUF849 family) [Maritimibacter alkaliphilus HTCC2654]